ncbi:MAG TPA: aspartate-semialdehyde dehydrogenase [Chloroflexota bacterium]|jgi:aspartate-semialdehyde dehydrogenase|nr:aspartate-semialdehyde dehydrogenase [Chloroflexota bacterium]
MTFAIGVVGATGQVGREFLRILEEGDRPDLPIKSLRLFASERSAGKRITVNGQELVVERAEPVADLFKGLDFVISAIGDSEAKVYSPAIAQAGAVNVDKSNAWRMDPAVPLVVPEVNPQAAREHRGIIAGPNCSTTQMVVALWPLHQVNPIKRIIVDTYQAVSGTGWRAVDELDAQAQAHATGGDMPRSVYPHQIHLNVIPEIGGLKSGGLYSEEQKMIDETRKIFSKPDLAISATCVRVPVAIGHSEAIHVEFEQAMGPDEARELLRHAPGVVVLDDPAASAYPMPLTTVGTDPVYVGRIRKDPSHPRGLALWVVGDNLRKGAALNAIQVFELLARNGWRSPTAKQEVHA